MADLPERTDWSTTEKHLEKQRTEEGPLPTWRIAGGDVLPSAEGLEEPKGLVAQYKANKVKRQAVIEGLTEWYKGQLDVAREQIKQGVRVNRAETIKSAERWLRWIDQEHLKFMDELGLQNVDTRQRMLAKLNDLTAENWRQAQEADWPEQLRESLIDRTLQLHERFAEELMRKLDQEDDG